MRRVVMVLCAALLCVPVILKSRMNQEIPDRTAFRTFSSAKITVKVSGNVSHAGIYEVSANILAVDAIKMADPVCPVKPSIIGYDASHPVQNGASLQFSVLPDGSQRITFGSMNVSERLVLNIPLDIAAMSEADFDRLPGIGPALAKRITEYRQKNGGILRVEDLAAVEGIGKKKLDMLRRYFQPSVSTR